MSSDKNLTLPNSAAFSQPNKLSGNLQEPSVTVLDLAKLAEEVIARFLSFISLFASEEANKSSVKPACACITGLDKVTTTAAAKAADLLKETFFCAEAVGFAAACVCVCVCVCVSFVSVLFHLHTLCVVAAEQQTRFFFVLFSPLVLWGREERGRTKKKQRGGRKAGKENDRVCAKSHRGTFSSLSLSLSSLSLSLSLFSFPILTRVYAHTTRVVDALLRRDKRDNRGKANQSASLRESFRTIFLVISLLSPLNK